MSAHSYLNGGLCSVCGKSRGGLNRNDHSKCSRIIQELHKNDSRARPVKKWSEKYSKHLSLIS
jgi:hypothetical protein